MSLDSHKIFSPRYHVVDLVSAFTRFQRKFGYIYEGENRTAPSTATTPETVAEWKDQDKAKVFLSRAVSDEFLDDFESTVKEDERAGINFTTLVKKMKERYTPSSNKVLRLLTILHIVYVEKQNIAILPVRTINVQLKTF